MSVLHVLGESARPYYQATCLYFDERRCDWKGARHSYAPPIDQEPQDALAAWSPTDPEQRAALAAANAESGAHRGSHLPAVIA